MMSDMSARQKSAWSWAGCLAPAVALMPVVAAQGGVGSWVAPLLALPGIWAVDWLLGRMGANGLARRFCGWLGRPIGCALTIIYIMWAVLLGGAQLRVDVQRVEVAAALPVYPWVLALGVVLLALWMARGKPAACARWSVIVLRGTLIALGALGLLALRQMRWENLVPFWSGGRGTLGVAGVAFAVMCVRIYGEFVPCGEGCKSVRHSALVCGVLSVLLLTVQGNLGVVLAARLEDPLLTLSRNVGVEGTFQRAESLLAAMLLLTDLAFLTLLLWSARSAAEEVWPVCDKGRFVAAIGLGMVVVTIVPVPAEWLDRFWVWAVPTMNFLLGAIIPALVMVVGRGKQEKNDSISCA